MPEGIEAPQFWNVYTYGIAGREFHYLRLPSFATITLLEKRPVISHSARCWAASTPAISEAAMRTITTEAITTDEMLLTTPPIQTRIFLEDIAILMPQRPENMFWTLGSFDLSYRHPRLILTFNGYDYYAPQPSVIR